VEVLEWIPPDKLYAESVGPDDFLARDVGQPFLSPKFSQSLEGVSRSPEAVSSRPSPVQTNSEKPKIPIGILGFSVSISNNDLLLDKHRVR
jgi:hypothetical protein